MKKYLILCVLFAVNLAQANNEAGVIIGSATGFSAKFDLSNKDRAVDMALAYNINSNSSLNFHADYLFENARIVQLEKTPHPLGVYYGLGVRTVNINTNDVNKGKTSIGLRAPVGGEYKITNPDLTFFGELAVVLDIVPESRVDIVAGLGVRIRF